MTANRLQRWSVILSGYNYEMKFFKGRDNFSADCLSKLPVFDGKVDTVTKDSEEYTYLKFVADNIKLITIEDVEKETDDDPILRQVREFILKG